MFESFLDGIVRSFLIVVVGFLLLLFLLVVLPLFLIVWVPSQIVFEKTHSQVWAFAVAYLIIESPVLIALVIRFKEEGVRGALKFLSGLLLVLAVAGFLATLIGLVVWYAATWGGNV